MAADDSTTLFRYFAEPHRFSTYQARPQECDICHEVLPGYVDAYFTDADGPDIKFVCEPDLRAGRLSEVKAQVNNGDRFALAEQIAEKYPAWSVAQIDEYTNARNAEVELATPSVTTWQDYEWPAHCADYMRYIKEIGQADCEELGGDQGGRAFFATNLEESYRTGEDEADIEAGIDELWEAMRPDAPVNNQEVTDTSFYLFQCIECGGYTIEWDRQSVEGVGLADA